MKKKNIIYSNMKYNRYMTDDRNHKSGKVFPKKIPNFVIMIIAKKQQYIIICL